MKYGELRELHELQFVGRIRYEHPKAFRELVETVVRHKSYSLQETNLALDLLIADDFLKTSKIGEALQDTALPLIKYWSTTKTNDKRVMF